MNPPITPIGQDAWIKGDYRYGASIRKEHTSIEVLAKSAGAVVQHFIEDGLGPGRVFGLRLPSGRQVAFEQYDGGASEVSLIVLFENGICFASEIWQVLELFGVQESAVTWLAPEAK